VSAYRAANPIFCKEVSQCQYLNISVKSAGTKRNSWKKAAKKVNTSVKNVGVRICKNFFRLFPLGKAVKEAVPAQPERADFLRKDVL
jgi:hypothetical protein